METVAEKITELLWVFGQQTERLWPQVVYATFLQAFFNALLCLGWIAAGILTLRTGWSSANRKNDSEDRWNSGDSEKWGWIGVGLMVVGGGVLFVATVSLPSHLTALMNPEGVTVLRIIERVSK